MNRIKPILIVLVVVLGVLGALRLVKMKQAALKKAPTPLKAPVPVTTVRAHKGTLALRDHYLGTIVPLERANISTRLTGYILKVTKFEGDPVKKGELLVSIEARALEAKLASLKASLQAAQSELLTKEAIFQRNKTLLAHEAISKEAFELSKSARDLARAKVIELRQELAAAKVDLSYAQIHAPFAGVVTKRFKDPGDLATPGAPILTLENPRGGYRILVKIPQERARLFAPGQPAYLLWQGQEKTVRIYRVHPAVGTEALATVEIRLKERPFGLPSGASVGVDLVYDQPEGLILPLKALVRGEHNAVYVVRKGRLALVPVKILGQSKDQIVVSGPLKAGEHVVIGDPGLLLRLHPGEKVLEKGL